MRNSLKVTLMVVAGVVAAILLVGGGLLLGADPDIGSRVRALLPGSASGIDYQLQQEVLEKVEDRYYKDLDPATLEAGAIDGMLAGLNDPYTVYLDPKEYAAFVEKSRGSYSGVGMVVEMKDGLVTIVSTFKGSPAADAGIGAGDIIVSVDGVSTDGENLDQVVTRIKGVEGTTVALGIYRVPRGTTTTTEPSGEVTTTTTEPAESPTMDLSLLPPGGETTEYTLTRKTIAEPVTEEETLETAGKKVALIHFLTFSQGSGKQLRAEVQKAMEDRVAAIILDLRSNLGGLLSEAVNVASIFIPDGTIVSTKGAHSPEEVYSATGDAFSQVPLYVLTDEYTASASEIVSGALQDYKRAVLIGETTFGKGLVQVIQPLSNGGAVKITIAVYLTPRGRDINSKGISPDISVADDPETADKDECVQAALGLISGSTATP
jgi:carboxyl-terminal processing protease